MRKAIKIKALTLVAAWSIILLHGVIPHNHEDHALGICHQLVHDTSDETDHSCEHDHDYESYTTSSDEHKTQVCHFSTNLNIHDNLDQLFITDCGASPGHGLIPGLQIILYGDTDSHCPPHYSLMPLRGPPSFA